MIKAVLVDDEILVLNLLKKIISETNDIKIIGAFTDPEQALKEIPKLGPDVLFLDVDMPEMNGLELATSLIEVNQNKEMSIVFVTAFEQYAIRAFELNAMHYILKPVDSKSVDEILKRVYQKKGIERKSDTGDGEIHFFGSMHLRVNGNQVDFLTPKIEELLALLIIHREKGISKWSLIDVLWDESSIEKSQQNLYTMIFRLKQTLRNAGIKIDIKSKNSIYRIDLADVYCDLVEFDRVMEKKLPVNNQNMDELERAVSVYQGDLLERKDYIWCIPIRERYYQQFLNMVVTIADYYAENHNLEKLRKLHQTLRHLLVEEDYEQLIK